MQPKHPLSHCQQGAIPTMEAGRDTVEIGMDLLAHVEAVGLDQQLEVGQLLVTQRGPSQPTVRS